MFRVLFAGRCLLCVDVLLWLLSFNLLMYMFVDFSLVVCLLVVAYCLLCLRCCVDFRVLVGCAL